MDRAEHLQWCKDRALEYVRSGNLTDAIASFQSDMGKHDETRSHSALPIMAQLMFAGKLSTPDDVINFIQGFN